MAERNSLNRKAGGEGEERSRVFKAPLRACFNGLTTSHSSLLKNLPPPKHAAVGIRLRTHRLWKTVSKLQQNVREGLVVREGLRAFSDNLSGRHHYEQ